MQKDILDKKSILIYKHYLQDEIDAAFLYRTLTGLKIPTKRKSIYSQLAEIEDKHANAWKELLEKNNIIVEKDSPSFKARAFAFISKKIGPGLLSQMMLKEESSEVKTYINLYRTSKSDQTQSIALRLARDSADHANQLMTSYGITEEPWHSSESGGMLRNIVYGFNDGLTANFGLIAGVIGASAAPHVILISGIAGMIADSLSMGSSGYLAAISEKEVYEHERKMEEEEIKLMPELETEELALIYESKGMIKQEARRLAEDAMKNPAQVLEDKVREELGITPKTLSPFTEGWITGLSTAIGAIIPILPFFFLSGSLAIWFSFIISMLSHFAVGAARSFFTGRGIFRSGLDMFVVGFGVAAVGYFIGDFVLKFLL
jgi:VIT1/CCC1 family predicted Fe2+/Mn2+ transporter